MGGLENRCTLANTEGSNPSPSSFLMIEPARIFGVTFKRFDIGVAGIRAGCAGFLPGLGSKVDIALGRWLVIMWA